MSTELLRYRGASVDSDESMPSIEADMKRYNRTKGPTIDSVASLVGRAILRERDYAPFSFGPRSKAAQDYLDPPPNDWQHGGTREVTLGKWKTRADLFVVSLVSRSGRGTGDPFEPLGMSLRVIFSQATRRTDGQPAPTPRAVMSVDNFPDCRVWNALNTQVSDADVVEPIPEAYIVSVPPSMISEIEPKIIQGGDADLVEDWAEATLFGIEAMLELHFKGEGQVTIPDPWPIPRASRSIAWSQAKTTGTPFVPTQVPLTKDEQYWDEEARKELRRSSASSNSKTGAKSKQSEKDAELDAAFEAIKSEMRTRRKKGSKKKAHQTTYDPASEAGPSTQTHTK